MRNWSKKIVIFSILLVLSLGLLGCESKKLNILVPTGSPEYALAYMKHSALYDLTTVSGADALVAGFNDIGYDIIIAPINMGAKLYNSKPNYQLAGVITWGNYYLISQTSFDLDEIDHLDITAFGENQIPDFMLKYILNHYDIEAQISYVDSVASITSAYLLDSSKIYLIAEPSMSILQTKSSFQFVDLQQAYQSISLETGFPQAGVFVHKDLSDHEVEVFQQRVENSIMSLKSDVHAIEILKEVGIEIPVDAFINAITRSNIDYQSATAAKTSVETFFEIIYEYNPNFIGVIPDSNFYR